MMEAVKFLRTSPHLTRWDTTHGVQTILSLETELTPTPVVKVELRHGIVTNTDTVTDHPQPVPLMDTCTIYGATGHKVLRPSHPTLATTTTQISSDSDGLRLMLILRQTVDHTRNTTGATTTHHIMVDKGPSSLLKDTLEVHTTSVLTWHIHTTIVLDKALV